MTNNLSINTHEFYTGNICDGSFGIYKAVRCLLKNSDAITDDEMHQQTIKYYFNNKNINSYGWCKDAERQVLAILYDITICLISQNENESTVTIKFYGEKSLLEKKFIYILYDEIKFNYYPLPLINTDNLKDEITILNHDDIIKNLLQIYIKDELKYEDEINLDDESMPMDSNDTNKNNETISDSTLMISTLKRKQPKAIDDIPLSSDKNKRLPPLISTKHDDLLSNTSNFIDSNKRIKLTDDSNDKILKFNKTNCETRIMKEFIQTDDIHDSDKMVCNSE